MSDTFSRALINALWPDGSFWTPAQDSDYDKLLDGIAANNEVVRLAMKALRSLRDPAKTPILSDLEKEYAVTPVPHATDAERRQRLAATMFQRNTLPTYEVLEAKLQAAGFDVFVHANSPAVDPNIFLFQSFQMTAGDILPDGHNAECGEPEAICSRLGGSLIVAGDVYIQSLNYSMQAGDFIFFYDDPIDHPSVCGEYYACCGQYNGVTRTKIEYQVPTNPGYWPLIFFVGGPATRDPVTGALTSIDIVQIPNEREAEFKRIILQYKSMHSWAGLVGVFEAHV